MPFNQDPFQPELPQEAYRTSDAIFESTRNQSGSCTPLHFPIHHKPWAGAIIPSDRPLNVKPTPAGGVAIDGQPNLPLGHATLSDKIVGKTQKVWLLP